MATLATATTSEGCRILLMCNKANKEQPKKQWAKWAALTNSAHGIESLSVPINCAIGSNVHAVHLFNQIWGILVVMQQERYQLCMWDSIERSFQVDKAKPQTSALSQCTRQQVIKREDQVLQFVSWSKACVSAYQQFSATCYMSILLRHVLKNFDMGPMMLTGW